MFNTTEYTFDGYNARDYNTGRGLGCFFGEFKIIMTGGNYTLSYELWYDGFHTTLLKNFRDMHDTDELDIAFQELMEKAFGDSKYYGTKVYYDCTPLAI